MAEFGMWRAEPSSGALTLKFTEGSAMGFSCRLTSILGVRDVLIGITGHDPKSRVSAIVAIVGNRRYFSKKIGTAQNFDVAAGWQLATRPK